MASGRANARPASCSACASCRSPKGSRIRGNLAFMPDGDSLIAELANRVRLVRGGMLAPRAARRLARCRHRADVAASRRPSIRSSPTNRFVYLYYVKTNADAKTTLALARGRLEGDALDDVREVFDTDGWIRGGPIAGRAVFGPDGMIYLTINDHDPNNAIDGPERTDLRAALGQRRRQGLAPPRRRQHSGRQPVRRPRRTRTGQIFTYGHRNTTDFAWHPTTGELWATEIGPMGGDEINILRAGHELRLAVRLARQAVHEGRCQRAALVPRGHGDAVDVLDAVDQPEHARLVHGRQARAMARAICSSGR